MFLFVCMFWLNNIHWTCLWNYLSWLLKIFPSIMVNTEYVIYVKLDFFFPICITLHLSTLNSDGTLLTFHLVSQGSSARFHSFPSLFNVKNMLLPLHASLDYLLHTLSLPFFHVFCSRTLMVTPLQEHCKSAHPHHLSIIVQLTIYA